MSLYPPLVMVGFLLLLMGVPIRASQPTTGLGSPAPSPDNIRMLTIPSGPFRMGSTRDEREYGYRLDETLHNSRTARRYRWFEIETQRELTLPTYHIDRLLVTNADYHRFIHATAHRAPFVTEPTWRSYGLIHDYPAVHHFLWRNRQFPAGRAQHPVVLVSHADAKAYCAWRGQREGRPLRLPTEAEWEKAARGRDGRYFPWGNTFEATRLNSYDKGPFDTVPVGQYPAGQSPYGAMDMAGQVFEWTSTVFTSEPSLKYVVKGGSWDDLPGVTRAAARPGRPAAIRHILVGFRCAASAGRKP